MTTEHNTGRKGLDLQAGNPSGIQTAKNLWIISVVGFWVSLTILIVIYFLKKDLNLVLASITLGLMLLGVWLKARYQIMVRRRAGTPDHGEDHQPGV